MSTIAVYYGWEFFFFKIEGNRCALINKEIIILKLKRLQWLSKFVIYLFRVTICL
jgi:hypothetical protein